MDKIMFNDEYSLTQAVLDERKKNTRRIIKLKAGEYVRVVALENGSFMSYVAKDGEPTAYADGNVEMPNFVRVLKPKYFIGQEVAVAQRYSECHRAVCLMNTKGWDNKMFTKALFLPHRIKITNIRVERLQDISDEDCMKEGVMHYDDVFGTGYMIADPYNNNYRRHCYTTPRKAFAGLIDKTCGKGTWDSNPYVFVYEFELIK